MRRLQAVATAEQTRKAKVVACNTNLRMFQELNQGKYKFGKNVS